MNRHPLYDAIYREVEDRLDRILQDVGRKYRIFNVPPDVILNAMTAILVRRVIRCGKALLFKREDVEKILRATWHVEPDLSKLVYPEVKNND